MITITLNQIHKASPHLSLWKKVLKAHEHLGMEYPFPLSSVLESNGLEDTLWCLDALGNKEILRRFALWCARQVQHLMTDERSSKALDIAEMFLDRKSTIKELLAAYACATSDFSRANTNNADNSAYFAIFQVARIENYAIYASACAFNCGITNAAQINKLKEMLS